MTHCGLDEAIAQHRPAAVDWEGGAQSDVPGAGRRRSTDERGPEVNEPSQLGHANHADESCRVVPKPVVTKKGRKEGKEGRKERKKGGSTMLRVLACGGPPVQQIGVSTRSTPEIASTSQQPAFPK